MTEYSMGWDEPSGRWRIWRVTRELVAEGLTLVQGERLLGQLRAAPGRPELQGCSLGGSPEKGVAPALRLASQPGTVADTAGGVDMQDDTTDVNPRAEAGDR